MNANQIISDAYRDCPADPFLSVSFLFDKLGLLLKPFPLPDSNLAGAIKLVDEIKLRLLQAGLPEEEEPWDESDLARIAEERRKDEMAYPSSGE